MIIQDLPEESLEATLRAIFKIPDDLAIQGVTAPGGVLASLSSVCGDARGFGNNILTVVTKSKDDGTYKINQKLVSPSNGANKSEDTGFVISATSPGQLAHLLNNHRDTLIVLAIVKNSADSGTYSVRSTLRALSKRMPTIVFIEADVYDIRGSPYMPARGSVLPVFQFFAEGELVKEYHGGSPTALTEVTLALARNATSAIAEKAALSPFPYSPARNTLRTSPLRSPYGNPLAVDAMPPSYSEGEGKSPAFQMESRQPSNEIPPSYKEVSPAALSSAVASPSGVAFGSPTALASPISAGSYGHRTPTAPPLGRGERKKVVLEVVDQLTEEGFLSPRQSAALSDIIRNNRKAVPELESSIQQLLLLAQDFLGTRDSRVASAASQPAASGGGSIYSPRPPMNRRASEAMEEYQGTIPGESKDDFMLGHDEVEANSLSAGDYGDLKSMLEILIKPLVNSGSLDLSDADMLRERVKEKEPILLGTLLNHAENGDTSETNNILIKIVRLNELAQDYQVGLNSISVRLAVLERFFRMRALRRKELSLLRLLVAEKDPEVDRVFKAYSRGAGGSGHRLNPAWLLERLVEILGEVSEDDDEEDEEEEAMQEETRESTGDDGYENLDLGALEGKGLGGLLKSLSTRPDVKPEEVRGIVYLVTNDPPASLLDVLEDVRVNGSDEDEAVSLLVQAYRQMKADLGDDPEGLGGEEDVDADVMSPSIASPRARAAVAAVKSNKILDEAEEWKAAMGSLRKLILAASLETPEVSQGALRRLYALAEDENPVVWAAFSLYRMDNDWTEFKDTLVRISRSKIQVPENVGEAGAGSFSNEYQGGKPLDTLQERDRTVGALLQQQGPCEKEMKVLILFQKEGYLERAEVDYLTNMVRARDPVIMAAFDVLRETHDWREMFDTMTRILRREAAVQLLSKYQDIYQKAVYKLLKRGEVDPSGALTLMKLLEDKDEKVIDWLGEIETFHGLRGETKVPNLMPLVRRVAIMALEPASPSLFRKNRYMAKQHGLQSTLEI